MAKILIVGCGDMGGRLARLAAQAGHQVHGLRRSAFTLPNVQAHQGDVTQAESLQLPAHIDYVFIVLSPDKSLMRSDAVAEYQRTYFKGTENVLQALAAQNVQRIFWISSSSVYAQAAGEWVTEQSPAAPESATAKILLATENLVLRAPWPATIVRFAGIYGPNRLRLLRVVESGQAVQAQPPAWTNRIHIDDCAALLFFLLQQACAGAALDEHYIGVDDAPTPQHEVLDWLAEELALPALPRKTAGAASMNKRLSNQKIKALGFSFLFPDYQAGYREIIGEYLNKKPKEI